MGAEMSKLVDPNRTLSARSHRNLQVDMELYANRLRLRLGHLDLSDPQKKRRLMDACNEMTKILVRKKIRQDVAQRTVAQTLDIAADHQPEVLRRQQNLKDLARSQRDLRRLVKQLEYLRSAIAKCSPMPKGKLNKIVANLDWRNFNTETFSELIEVITEAVSESSPACTSEKIITAINEKVRSGTHPAVAKITRTAPPAPIELWETIPSETRTQVEACLQKWAPPMRGAATEYLNHLVSLLQKFQPQLKRGQRPPITRRFGERVASIWQDLGLHVGRVFTRRRVCT
jgi:hypothetical protein